MNKLYDAFLTYIRCELNESAHTVTSYGYDLQQWHSFSLEAFGAHFDPLRVVVGDLRLWVAHLSSQGRSARTIRRKVQTLRAFYTYLQRRGLCSANPAADLVTAKAPKSLPRALPTGDVGKALDRHIDTTDFEELRNMLIVNMLYATGMRASEMLGLLADNIDTNRRELKVLGKRNKERIIPFGQELNDMIAQYTALRPETSSPQFFVTRKGLAMTYRELNSVVKSELSSRVRNGYATAHMLRHTFATDMLNNGAEITAVQQLMGHASLAATQIYTHLSYRELQHNYQLAHPRAQKKG